MIERDQKATIFQGTTTVGSQMPWMFSLGETAEPHGHGVGRGAQTHWKHGTFCQQSGCWKSRNKNPATIALVFLITLFLICEYMEKLSVLRLILVLTVTGERHCFEYSVWPIASLVFILHRESTLHRPLMERASAPRLKRFVSQQALRILRAQEAFARVSTLLWVTPKLVKYL